MRIGSNECLDYQLRYLTGISTNFCCFTNFIYNRKLFCDLLKFIATLLPCIFSKLSRESAADLNILQTTPSAIWYINVPIFFSNSLKKKY